MYFTLLSLWQQHAVYSFTGFCTSTYPLLPSLPPSLSINTLVSSDRSFQQIQICCVLMQMLHNPTNSPEVQLPLFEAAFWLVFWFLVFNNWFSLSTDSDTDSLNSETEDAGEVRLMHTHSHAGMPTDTLERERERESVRWIINGRDPPI